MTTKKGTMTTKRETGGKAKKAEVLSDKDLAGVQGGWSWGETNDSLRLGGRSGSGTGNKTSPDQIGGKD